MPYKNKEAQKRSQAEYYQKNKAIYQQKDRDRIERNRKWLAEYKATCKCCECPESRVACLDFHHVDPATKVMNVCEMVNNRYSIQRIQEEIAKCIVLCANCHRVNHHGNVWEGDSRER